MEDRLRDILDNILNFIEQEFLSNEEFDLIKNDFIDFNYDDENGYKSLYRILNKRNGDSGNSKIRLKSYFYAKTGENYNFEINNNNIPLGVVL